MNEAIEQEVDVPDILEDVGAGEPEEIQEEVQEAAEAQEPEAATQARQSGWVPQDEWKGDPDKWVPADEFNRRGELFDTIHSQKREIGELKEAVGFLTDHTKKVEKITRENTIAEIEAKRREAVEDGDIEAFEEADQQYKEAVKEEQGTLPDIDPAIDTWVKGNSWYEKDPELQEYMLFQQNKNLGEGMTVKEALRVSEQAVRRTFPHKFENPNKQRAAAVLPKQSVKATSLSESDLSPQERSVFRTLNRQVGMKLEEYVAELKKAENG